MRRVLCFAFVLVGLLAPNPWVEIDRAQAFNGVVVKCVGFDAFTDIEARVYMQNDGPKSLNVIRIEGETGGRSGPVVDDLIGSEEKGNAPEDIAHPGRSQDADSVMKARPIDDPELGDVYDARAWESALTLP